MELVYYNGWPGLLEDARVPVNGRGYSIGDGVYQVAQAYNGVMFAVS